MEPARGSSHTAPPSSICLGEGLSPGLRPVGPDWKAQGDCLREERDPIQATVMRGYLLRASNTLNTGLLDSCLWLLYAGILNQVA